MQLLTETEYQTLKNLVHRGGRMSHKAENRHPWSTGLRVRRSLYALRNKGWIALEEDISTIWRRGPQGYKTLYYLSARLTPHGAMEWPLLEHWYTRGVLTMEQKKLL